MMSPHASQSARGGLLGGERLTLLRRSWKFASLAIFTAFAALILAVHLWELDIHQSDAVAANASCISSGSKTCLLQPLEVVERRGSCHFIHSTHTWGAFTTACQTGSVGAYLGNVSLQIVRLIFSNKDGEGAAQQGESASATLALGVLAGLAEAIIYARGNNQITCTDMHGASIPLFQLIEWVVSVPFLVYIALAVDSKVEFSRFDLLSIASTFFTIVLAFVAQLTTRLVFYAVLMSLSVATMLSVVVSFYGSIVEADAIVKSTNVIDKNNGDYMYKYLLARRKRTCLLILSITYPLFPIAYFARASGLLSHDFFSGLLSILGCFAKIVFMNVCCEAHQEMSNPAFVMLAVEKQANTARRAFLRYVFHEVRVPLNSFSMGVEVLADSGSDGEIVEALRDSCKNMNETLNDILSLQKIEEGVMRLVYRPFCVQDLMQALLLDVEPSASEKDIALSVTYTNALPARIYGDKFRLGHAIRAVLSNAIKFGFCNTTIKASVTCSRYNALNSARGSMVPTWPRAGKDDLDDALEGGPDKVVIEISITDIGEGIAEEDIANIFTPFLFTRPELSGVAAGASHDDAFAKRDVKNAPPQASRGSGISLAISKEIVDLHNGVITCSSRGRGRETSFTMTVPFGVVEWGLGAAGKGRRQGREDLRKTVRESAQSKVRVSVGESGHKSSGDLARGNKSSGDLARGQWLEVLTPPAVSDPRGSPGRSIQSFTAAAAPPDGVDNDVFAQSEKDNANITTDLYKYRAESREANLRILESSSAASSSASDEKPLMALVVDDAATSRKLLSMLLKNHRVECEMAEDGLECCEKVEGAPGGLSHFDVIFLDNTMPRMTGIEAARRLRANAYPNLIVGITGNCMKDELAAFSTSGADLVLTKPASRKVLASIFAHIRERGPALVPGFKFRLTDEDELLSVPVGDESSAPLPYLGRHSKRFGR